jgi:Domain of unknown function (DUF5666)
VDEITLFDELKPSPLPDVPQMREAVRARLAAAASAPAAHPARRRNTVVAVAAGAALMAAGGAGYGLAAAGGGPGPLPTRGTPRAGATAPQGTAAGLTAVHGCPGEYITAGKLKQASGTQLILQPANDTDHVNRDWRAKPVTVATTPSTAITRPATGTVGDITDGSHVDVQGTWSGGKLAAAEVGIEAALPSPGSFGPKISGPKVSGHLPRHLVPKGTHGSLAANGPLNGPAGPPFANGKVTSVHGGSFTVVTWNPLQGSQRVQVTTSSSTKVVAKTSTSLSQLSPGANLVVVGQIGPHGVLTASTVAEPSMTRIVLAGVPAKIRPSGCSTSAITTAAILAGS